MSTPARRPVQLRSERSRASRCRVIDATIACIAGDGFARASTTQIVKRVGVTWGVLQHQFGGKVATLEAVVDRLLDSGAGMDDGQKVPGDTIRQDVVGLERVLWRVLKTPTYRALLGIRLNARHGDVEGELGDRVT